MLDFSAQIIVIDDDIEMDTKPLFRELQKTYKQPNVDVIWYKDPDEGVAYVKAHLTKRTVIVLDYSFKSNKNGLNWFLELQNKSSLVYIILNTTKRINEIDKDDLKTFINNHLMAIVDKTDGYTKTVAEVAKGFKHLSRGVDAALEEWITELDEDERTAKTIVTRGGESWSLEDLLQEIRARTDEGKEAEHNIITLAIDLINRGRRPLLNA